LVLAGPAGGDITLGPQAGTPPGIPNGNPCAGQELTLRINGKEGSTVVAYGPIPVRGVLHCGTVPIRNAQVLITTTGSSPEASTSTWLQTTLDGSFSYTLPAGPNRTLNASYTSYSDDPYPSVTATTTIKVAPKIELQILPRTVHNHHVITWRGKILGGPFPEQGVTLNIEVKIGKHWMPFAELIVPKEGDFGYSYRFLRTTTPTTYAFRVALPATGSGEYPYTFGSSNVVTVRVLPQSHRTHNRRAANVEHPPRR
jgi:hypothetical protein